MKEIVIHQGRKILYLEGVRGIAASGVVLAHYVLAFYGAAYYLDPRQVHTGGGIELELGRSFLSFFFQGNFTVPMLFVLSAYVLAYRYFRYQDANTVRASAWRRYIRLAIPNAFSVLVCYGLICFGLLDTKAVLPVTLSTWAGNCYNFPPDILEALRQGLWEGFFSVIPPEKFYNPATWTMFYEMGGSFFLFSFLLLFGRAERRWLMYILAFCLFGRTHYFAFILGIALADLFNSASGERVVGWMQRQSWLPWGLLFLGFCLTGYFNDGRNGWSEGLDWLGAGLKYCGYDLWIFYHDLGAAFMLAGVLMNRSLQRFLQHRLLVFLGRISYSMYLIHMALIFAVAHPVFLYFFQRGQRYSVSVLIALTVCSVCVLLAAWGMTRFVDEPAIRFARYIQKRYFSHVAVVRQQEGS